MIKAEVPFDSFSRLYGLFYYFKKILLSVLWTFEEGSLPFKFKWSFFFHSPPRPPQVSSNYFW